MRRLLRLATITLVLFLARTPAQAGQLALDFEGVAAPPSSLGSTSFIGDPFTVQADFDPTTETTIQQGAASYVVTSIALTVGGTSYSVTDPSDYSVILVDGTNPYSPGIDNLSLHNTSTDYAFSPSYTMSTSAFSAIDPSPTVFSGYSAANSLGGILVFTTPAGYLTLRYNPNVGVGASINSVPEPSSLALCGIGGSIGLVVARRRRKRVT